MTSTPSTTAAGAHAPAAASNAIRIGYARVSTRGQDHAAQLELLNAADCREIIEETISTRRAHRPKLMATVAAMKPGDTLVITKPDRVARSVKELLVFLEDELAPRGINLHILTGICAGIHRPTGQSIADKMLFLVAAMAAEMERDLISERTLEGLDAARAAGRVGGRPVAVTDDVLAMARARRARGQSVTQIARELGIGRSTLYRALEDDPSAPAATTVAATAAAPVDQDHEDHAPPGHGQERAIEEPATGDDAGQSGGETDVDRVDRPRELRTVARLGPDWATDDNDVLWWRRETRAGSVSPAWPGTGWTARTAQHTPITTGAGNRGAYSSRIKALAAVAADCEARHRARTAHADVALDGAPGWRLTQTQADHDRHRWNVVTPAGDVAGTVSKADWHHQAWDATAGDPANRHHHPVPVEPIGDEPGRSSADGYWRTRNAAALAVARWHDPDLDTGRTVRQ
ncbi:recombinase family protein [Nonomuraea sp. NPDC050691]|uniref:recombinase family protein n=1 Tax=Nonomuraea sp. NPDC050691 TaxID=3155661 RepID=UPI0033D24059